MTDTIEPVKFDDDENMQIARTMVAQARASGVDLVGPDGLLAGLTKQVLELALKKELTDHLGYPPGEREGKSGTNERNGSRSKTVVTESGPAQIDVPRDREGTFTPAIVRKRQRRLWGVDELVLSLTARGLTTGEIEGHDQPDHGEGHRRDGRVADPSPGQRLSGDLHRRDRGQRFATSGTFWGSGQALPPA